MKLNKISLREFLQTDEILGKKAQKYILGGYSTGSCNTCKCYNEAGTELGNLGKKTNSTACWDACVDKNYPDFHGHKCT